MKWILFVFVFGLTLATCEIGSSTRDDSVDAYFTQMLINFGEAMRIGVPQLGIPILDPLKVEYFEFLVHENLARLDANASNTSISDHSYYVPYDVHVSIADLEMELKMNTTLIQMHGIYWCVGVLLNVFPVWGSGPYHIYVHDTQINGNGSIFITPDGYIQVSNDLGLGLTFEELDVDFENFLGGGSFGDEVNEALGDLGKLFFEAMLPFLNNAVLPALIDYMNDALMEHTLEDIIGGALPGGNI